MAQQIPANQSGSRVFNDSDEDDDVNVPRRVTFAANLFEDAQRNAGDNIVAAPQPAKAPPSAAKPSQSGSGSKPPTPPPSETVAELTVPGHHLFAHSLSRTPTPAQHSASIDRRKGAKAALAMPLLSDDLSKRHWMRATVYLDAGHFWDEEVTTVAKQVESFASSFHRLALEKGLTLRYDAHSAFQWAEKCDAAMTLATPAFVDVCRTVLPAVVATDVKTLATAPLRAGGSGSFKGPRQQQRRGSEGGDEWEPIGNRTYMTSKYGALLAHVWSRAAVGEVFGASIQALFRSLCMVQSGVPIVTFGPCATLVHYGTEGLATAVTFFAAYPLRTAMPVVVPAPAAAPSATTNGSDAAPAAAASDAPRYPRAGLRLAKSDEPYACLADAAVRLAGGALGVDTTTLVTPGASLFTVGMALGANMKTYVTDFAAVVRMSFPWRQSSVAFCCNTFPKVYWARERQMTDVTGGDSVAVAAQQRFADAVRNARQMVLEGIDSDVQLSRARATTAAAAAAEHYRRGLVRRAMKKCGLRLRYVYALLEDHLKEVGEVRAAVDAAQAAGELVGEGHATIVKSHAFLSGSGIRRNSSGNNNNNSGTLNKAGAVHSLSASVAGAEPVVSRVNKVTAWHTEVLRLLIAAEMSVRTLKWMHRVDYRLEVRSSAATNHATDPTPSSDAITASSEPPLTASQRRGSGVAPSVSPAHTYAETLNRLLYENFMTIYEAWPLQTCLLAYLKFGLGDKAWPRFDECHALNKEAGEARAARRVAVLEAVLREHGVSARFAWCLAPPMAGDKPRPVVADGLITTCGEWIQVVGGGCGEWIASLVTTAASVLDGPRAWHGTDVGPAVYSAVTFSGIVAVDDQPQPALQGGATPQEASTGGRFIVRPSDGASPPPAPMVDWTEAQAARSSPLRRIVTALHTWKLPLWPTAATRASAAMNPSVPRTKIRRRNAAVPETAAQPSASSNGATTVDRQRRASNDHGAATAPDRDALIAVALSLMDVFDGSSHSWLTTAGASPALATTTNTTSLFRSCILLVWEAYCRAVHDLDCVSATLPSTTPPTSWLQLMLTDAAASMSTTVAMWLTLATGLTTGSPLSMAATTRCVADLQRFTQRNLHEGTISMASGTTAPDGDHQVVTLMMHRVAQHTTELSERAALLLAALDRTLVFPDVLALLTPTNTYYASEHATIGAVCEAVFESSPAACPSTRALAAATDMLATCLSGAAARMTVTAEQHREADGKGWHDTIYISTLRMITKAVIATISVADSDRTSTRPLLQKRATRLCQEVMARGYALTAVTMCKLAFGDSDPQTAVALSHYSTIALFAQHQNLNPAQRRCVYQLCGTLAAASKTMTVKEMKRFVRSEQFAEQLAAAGNVMIETGHYDEQQFTIDVAAALLRNLSDDDDDGDGDDGDAEKALRKHRGMAAILERRALADAKARDIQSVARRRYLRDPTRFASRLFGRHHAYSWGVHWQFTLAMERTARIEVFERETIQRKAIEVDGLRLSAIDGELRVLLLLLQCDHDLHARRWPYLALYAAQVAQKALNEAFVELEAAEAVGRSSIVREALLWYGGEVRAAFVRERLLVRNVNHLQKRDATAVAQAKATSAAAMRQAVP